MVFIITILLLFLGFFCNIFIKKQKKLILELGLIILLVLNMAIFDFGNLLNKQGKLTITIYLFYYLSVFAFGILLYLFILKLKNIKSIIKDLKAKNNLITNTTSGLLLVLQTIIIMLFSKDILNFIFNVIIDKQNVNDYLFGSIKTLQIFASYLIIEILIKAYTNLINLKVKKSKAEFIKKKTEENKVQFENNKIKQKENKLLQFLCLIPIISVLIIFSFTTLFTANKAIKEFNVHENAVVVYNKANKQADLTLLTNWLDYKKVAPKSQWLSVLENQGFTQKEVSKFMEKKFDQRISDKDISKLDFKVEYSPIKEWKNGDEINVTVQYNKDYANSQNIKITNNEWKIKIEGLDDKTIENLVNEDFINNLEEEQPIDQENDLPKDIKDFKMKIDGAFLVTSPIEKINDENGLLNQAQNYLENNLEGQKQYLVLHYQVRYQMKKWFLNEYKDVTAYATTVVTVTKTGDGLTTSKPKTINISRNNLNLEDFEKSTFKFKDGDDTIIQKLSKDSNLITWPVDWVS